MSLWSTIGKVAGVASIPFTGGGSLIPILAGAGGGYALSKAFGGGKDNKDDDPEGSLNQTIASLKDNSTRMRGTAAELGSQGQDVMGPVMQYLKGILGDDPSALLEATAPERARVMDQYDAARQSIAQFAPRGGGSSGAIADSFTSEASDLSNITALARRNAMSTGASLGSNLAGLSLSAEQLASMDLNSVISAVLGQEGIDATKRGQNMEALSALGEAIGTIIASKAGGG